MHARPRGSRPASRATSPRPARLVGPVGPVGVDLEVQVGEGGPHRRHRHHVPARGDLEPDPGEPGTDQGRHRVDQGRQVLTGRDPGHRAGLDGAAGPAQPLGERPSDTAQPGSRAAISSRRPGHAVHAARHPRIRATTEGSGNIPPRAPAAADSRPTSADQGLPHRGHRRVDGRAVGQGPALAPPFRPRPAGAPGIRTRITGRRSWVPAEVPTGWAKDSSTTRSSTPSSTIRGQSIGPGTAVVTAPR